MQHTSCQCAISSHHNIIKSTYQIMYTREFTNFSNKNQERTDLVLEYRIPMNWGRVVCQLSHHARPATFTTQGHRLAFTPTLLDSAGFGCSL